MTGKRCCRKRDFRHELQCKPITKPNLPGCGRREYCCGTAQVLLSKIDVHVEQAPERGIYFSPHSPDELAARMIMVHRDYSPASEQCYVEQREEYKSRVERDWIDNFSRILKTVSCA